MKYNSAAMKFPVISAATEGCLAADLELLVDRAIHSASIRYIKAQQRHHHQQPQQPQQQPQQLQYHRYQSKKLSSNKRQTNTSAAAAASYVASEDYNGDDGDDAFVAFHQQKQQQKQLKQRQSQPGCGNRTWMCLKSKKRLRRYSLMLLCSSGLSCLVLCLWFASRFIILQSH